MAASPAGAAWRTGTGALPRHVGTQLGPFGVREPRRQALAIRDRERELRRAERRHAALFELRAHEPVRRVPQGQEQRVADFVRHDAPEQTSVGDVECHGVARVGEPAMGRHDQARARRRHQDPLRPSGEQRATPNASASLGRASAVRDRRRRPAASHPRHCHRRASRPRRCLHGSRSHATPPSWRSRRRPLIVPRMTGSSRTRIAGRSRVCASAERPLATRWKRRRTGGERERESSLDRLSADKRVMPSFKSTAGGPVPHSDTAEYRGHAERLRRSPIQVMTSTRRHPLRRCEAVRRWPALSERNYVACVARFTRYFNALRRASRDRTAVAPAGNG